MRLIMVRHGDPNYEHDCLTAKGHQQAAAVAERLAGEGITAIYSSPMGRARQTASYTEKRLGLTATVLDFMHEITWGGPGLPDNGHPWTLGDRMMTEITDTAPLTDWRHHPYFRGNAAVDNYDMVTRAFDRVLETLGYRHTDMRFLCTAPAEQTVALFSHGGSGACVIAHLLALPFPYLTSAMTYDFTSVTVLNFPSRPGEYVFPRLELFNDVHHLQGASGPVIQQTPDPV